MPNWISNGGTWHPAKEHVVLPHLAGTKNEIYDGPDRAALLELFRAKVETFGQDFRTNPDFLQGIRAQGYDNVDKYLESIGYDEAKEAANFKKKAEKVTTHEIKKRVKAINTMGGGRDFSGGGQDKRGGFGQRPKE